MRSTFVPLTVKNDTAMLPIKQRDAHHWGTISASDADRVGLTHGKRWSLQSRGYACSSIRQANGRSRTVLLHRLIMDPAAGQVVDHINGNPLDNRRQNLRLTDARGNAQHRPNTDQTYRGTYLGSYGWVAWARDGRARADGRYCKLYNGTYKTREDAPRAAADLRRRAGFLSAEDDQGHSDRG